MFEGFIFFFFFFWGGGVDGGGGLVGFSFSHIFPTVFYTSN